jgi:hypothetical protein
VWNRRLLSIGCENDEAYLGKRSRDGQQPMRVKTLLMIPGINTNTSHSQTPITKMPPHPTVAQIRLNNISKCLAVTADTLEIIANSLKTPFLQAIVNTTQSLLENIQVNPFTECSASSSVFHCRQ